MNAPIQEYEDSGRICSNVDVSARPPHSHDDVTRKASPTMNKLLKITPQEMAKMFDLDQAASQRRILVVDDDPDIRHLMSEVLASSGYAVDVAENGTRAWKALHLKRYDLIVTDYDMPGMTGIQLVSKLRLAGFQLPVILASGSPPPDLIIRKTAADTVVMLPKPFTLGELTRLVEELLPESGAKNAASLEGGFMESLQETTPRF